MNQSKRTSYAKSGVSFHRAYQFLDILQRQRPISFFASIVDVDGARSKGQLAFSSDGVGTKIELLARFDLNWISGWDCVAMNANDLLCVGAQPLWFLDYFAQGHLDKKVFKQVLYGINKALDSLGASLVGGETAELPRFFASEKNYELCGFLAGIVDPQLRLGSQYVREGDILIGLASSGPHANGFSLIRNVLSESDVIKRKKDLLAPTRLYHPILNRIFEISDLKNSCHAICHITGGAFVEKLPRVLPDHLAAIVDLGSWAIPPIFECIRQEAGLSIEAACKVLNMGVGCVLVCDPNEIERMSRYLKNKIRFWRIGEIVRRKKSSGSAVFFNS